MRKLSAILLALLIPGLLWAAENVRLTPHDWKFGPVEQGKQLSQTVTVENNTASPLTLDIVSTCDCLKTSPAQLKLKPGAKGQATLTYDTSEDSGDIKKFYIIRSDFAALKKALYPVTGTIMSAKDSVTESPLAPPAEEMSTAGGLSVKFYYTPGCKKCEQFFLDKLPLIIKDLGQPINLQKLDVLDPKIYEAYMSDLAALGVEAKAFPVLIAGSLVLQGIDDVNGRTLETLRQAAAGNTNAPAVSGAKPAQRELLLLPVVAAGLLDGINPCAFTTLIFLLSYLALAGRGRREILVIGLFFTLSVFVTYYLIGLGFFHALRAAQGVPLIGIIIKWVLMSVLVIFAVISFYDFILIRKGRSKDIVLQLPDAIKQQLHKSIRTYARSAALIGSSVILGFLVSVFELACTGQIYFPTITYYIQMDKKISAYFFLAIYNFSFIIPLIIVFALTYIGVSHKKITEVFQKHLASVKIGTVVLFLALAVLVILF